MAYYQHPLPPTRLMRHIRASLTKKFDEPLHKIQNQKNQTRLSGSKDSGGSSEALHLFTSSCLHLVHWLVDESQQDDQRDEHVHNFGSEHTTSGHE